MLSFLGALCLGLSIMCAAYCLALLLDKFSARRPALPTPQAEKRPATALAPVHSAFDDEDD